MTEAPMLTWAQWYHSRGMHPMPLVPGDKRPLLEHWTQYQTTQPTLEEVVRWWTEWPNANIGLIQGRGQFVLDIDGAEGEAALAQAGVEVPSNTPQVKTAHGRHIYFTGHCPQRGAALPKVDTRSDGGYVVAPPSLHPEGMRYEWIYDLWPPIQAPAKLIEVLSKPKVTKPGDKPPVENWLVDALGGIDKGQRDIMCARLAGYLWGKGLPEEVVDGILQNWAAQCTPPFPAKEVTKTVLSICKREGGPLEGPGTIADVIGKTLAAVLAPPQDRPPVASTSLDSLDKLLDGGFFPGDVVMLASRPSVGKSALALQIARQSALKGAGVLYVSLEMSATALARRMLVQESGIPMSVLKTGEGLTPVSSQALVHAAGVLDKLPIWITTNVASAEDLHETIATFEPGVIRLAVVDYLQIMDAEGRDGRARVEHCSKLIKRAAIKYNVPILLLSSLSRPPRENDSWRPELRDLRESGELEHDADIVLMPHRELTSDLCEIYLRKQRDGKVDAKPVLTYFDGSRQTFREKR